MGLANFSALTAFIPHGHCYLWNQGLVGLHVASDTVIAIAYYSIPIALIYFVRKRQDLPYRWIFLLFSLFILSCGTTHLMEVWTLWHPTYWLSGAIKAITAAVSLYTAVELMPLIPQALALPSPGQLEAANQELERQMIERQQMQEALRESEECFRNAFDNAAIGMALVTPDGRWLKVNHSLCEIVGYCERELLASTIDAITHPEDQQADLNYTYTRQLLAGEIRTYHLEKRYIHKSGNVVWILLSASLVRDAYNQPLYFIAQIKDITARKQAEAALQQARQQLESRVGERTDELAKANEELRAEIAERKRLQQQLQQAKEELEHRVAQRTEQLFQLNEELNKEINERQQAYKALRWSEKRYRAIVEDQTELIVRFQPDGKLTFANDAYCRYFKRSPEELIGQSYEPIIFEEDREHINRLLSTLNADNPVVMIENRVIVDGEVRWTQWINRMIFDRQGHLVEFQAVGRDISDRKQAEQALRESEERFQAFMNYTPTAAWICDEDGQIIYVNPTYLRILQLPTTDLVGKSLFDIYPPELAQQYVDNFKIAAQTNQAYETIEYCLRSDGTMGIFIVYKFLISRQSKRCLLGGVAVDITERQQAEDQVKASLAEKEVLLKEIHHRVKNNLQVICSLLNLQARHITEQPVLDIFKESQNRVRSMALIHEKLYISKDLSKINFADYIRDLANNLFRSYNVRQNFITLITNVSNIFLDLDTAVPCGLLINELLSNSLKHAFPEATKGEIWIEFYSDYTNQYTLAIRDTGIGLPPDIDFKTTKSLGLQLVCSLAKQLRGDLEINRQIGTEFKIKFSVHN